MRLRLLIVGLFLSGLFGLAAYHDSWRSSALDPGRRESFLTLFLGDGRRLFANHFFVKADVYMHEGFYPGIFDDKAQFQAEHEQIVAAEQKSSADPEHEEAAQEHKESSPAAEKEHGEGGHVHDASCSHGKDHGPTDWIERLGRHFYPSEHRHISAKKKAGPAEMFPWIELSSQLDPNNVRIYTTGAYWLQVMEKPAEARDFLRRGLKANPRHPELLLELGKIYENEKELPFARNLYQSALEQWDRLKKDPDDWEIAFVGAQLLMRLSEIETNLGNYPQAIALLQRLSLLRGNPPEIQQRIEEVRQRQKEPGTPSPGTGPIPR